MLQGYENRAIAPTRTGAAMLQSGVVMRWFGDRGFGFLRGDGADVDVFVHVSNVIGAVVLHPGARVSFSAGVNGRTGKPEAQNVRLAN